MLNFLNIWRENLPWNKKNTLGFIQYKDVELSDFFGK